MPHRGVVVASHDGRAPCMICNQPVRIGDRIVKRWNRWIHIGCYDELQAAKTEATSRR